MIPQWGIDKLDDLCLNKRNRSLAFFWGTEWGNKAKGAVMVEKGQRVVGYVRVSTDEQGESGLGLEAQREVIESACESRGLQLVEVIEDSGFSGGTLERPGLQRALLLIAEGKAEGLIASNLDRVSRSMVGFGRLVEWFEDSEAALVLLDQGVDTSTAAGRSSVNMMVVQAQYLREAIAERTRLALEAKRRRGEAISRPSVLDQPELVEKIRELHKAGLSDVAIAAELNEQGIPTVRGGAEWRPSAVRTCRLRIEGKAPRRKRRESHDLPKPRKASRV